MLCSLAPLFLGGIMLLFTVTFTSGTTQILILTTVIAVMLLAFVGLTAYNRWYLSGRTGQSWGRKAMGIRLVSAQTGQPIGPKMAFIRDRYIRRGSILDLMAMMRNDEWRQTYADRVVGTYVIVDQ